MKAALENIIKLADDIKSRWSKGSNDPEYRIKFTCNVCGARSGSTLGSLERERPTCGVCGSTVRMRAIVHILSVELFGESLTLQQFPDNPGITGIGLSDWEGYAKPLAKKLGYINTYYHKEPRLDITSIDASQECKYDFLISSDVFEHVLPPVSRAFTGAHRLLKNHGFIIITVPYGINSPDIIEHYPEIFNFEVATLDGRKIIRNRTKDGREQIFSNPVFHGGDGDTLEMRLFMEQGLLNELKVAGFSTIKKYDEPCLKYGIYWKHPWSLPVMARK